METKTAFLDPYQIKIGSNTRSVLNKESIAELSASIQSQGQQQAILVRPVGKSYELVYGRRRIEAAKLLGPKEKPFMIKAEIREVNDGDIEEIQTIENLQREDIPPIDEAATFKRLLEKEGFTVDTLAIKIGKSKRYILQRVSLNDLPDPIKKALESNEILLSHAIILARYPGEKQLHYFKAITHHVAYNNTIGSKRDGMLSTKELEKILKSNQEYDLSKVLFNITDPELTDGTPACTTCPKNTSNDIGLFEHTKKNTCTDEACRELKTIAHIKKQAELTPGAVFTELNSYPTHRTPGIKGKERNSYRESKKNECSNTVTGIIVAADRKEMIGTTHYICFTKDCKTHGDNARKLSSSSSGLSAVAKAQIAKRNAYNKRRKMEIAAMDVYRPQLVAEVLSKLPKDHIEFYRTIALRRYDHSRKSEKFFSMDPVTASALGLIDKNSKAKHSVSIPVTKITECKDIHFLQKLIFASAIDSYCKIGNWQSYETLKNYTQLGGDYLLDAANKIVGKKKTDEIIKAAEAIHIKQPSKPRSKSKSKPKTKTTTKPQKKK